MHAPNSGLLGTVPLISTMAVLNMSVSNSVLTSSAVVGSSVDGVTSTKLDPSPDDDEALPVDDDEALETDACAAAGGMTRTVSTTCESAQACRSSHVSHVDEREQCKLIYSSSILHAYPIALLGFSLGAQRPGVLFARGRLIVKVLQRGRRRAERIADAAPARPHVELRRAGREQLPAWKEREKAAELMSKMSWERFCKLALITVALNRTQHHNRVMSDDG